MRQTSGVRRPGIGYGVAPETREARERRLWPRTRRVEPLRFRHAPLLAAAVCFALGEAIPKLTPTASRPSVLLLAATLGLATLALLALRRTVRIILLPLGALWIAAGLWAGQIEPQPSAQSGLLAYADGLSRTVQARVTRIRELPARSSTDAPEDDTDPDQWDESGTPTTSVDLGLASIEDVTPDISRMVPIDGGLRITLLAPKPPQAMPPLQLHCGDLIEAPLRLRVPDRYRDPGAWQYADYLLNQGIAATANVPTAKLRILAPAPAALTETLRCRLSAAQTWASARLLTYTRSTANRRLPAALRLSPEDAGMLNAMLFGDRTRLTHSLRLGFERTGSFHLFVVSGMHVALLAGCLFWIARRLRLRDSLATVVTLTFTSAYALLTGFGIPVRRALLMTAVFLLARLLSRERNVPNALGAAALAVLVWSPRALFESSFQMTVLAIVAIAGIAVPLGERSFLPSAYAARDLDYRWKDTTLPPRLAQFRVMLRLWQEAFAKALGPRARRLPSVVTRVSLWALELALIGLVAEAVMVLPMALYFHRATVFSLPANMVSIPLVAILAPLGIGTFCASLLGSWLAALPSAFTAVLLHAITYAISDVSHAQAADLRVPGPTLYPALLALACVGFCCWAVRRSRTLALAAIAILPLSALVVLWPEPAAIHANQLEVTAIDVGQGDSLLVVGPSGRTMLIDAGGPTGAAANAENASGTPAFDVGEEVVSPYLWSRQLRTLDIVALTHAHSDHMGGMPAILRNFHPRELWVSIDSAAPGFHALMDEAASLDIPVRHFRAGDTTAWDGIAISVLAPTAAYVNTGPPVNNDSLVLRLRFGQASALLEGDAEAPSERSMIARAEPSSSSNDAAALGPDTLLKVGHHGSRTSTTPDFLSLAAPRYAIISVGRHNTFGHPRPEIVERLAAAHARVFRTDRFGLTTFLLDHDGRISVLNPTSDP